MEGERHDWRFGSRRIIYSLWLCHIQASTTCTGVHFMSYVKRLILKKYKKKTFLIKVHWHNKYILFCALRADCQRKLRRDWVVSWGGMLGDMRGGMRLPVFLKRVSRIMRFAFDKFHNHVPKWGAKSITRTCSQTLHFSCKGHMSEKNLRSTDVTVHRGFSFENCKSWETFSSSLPSFRYGLAIQVSPCPSDQPSSFAGNTATSLRCTSTSLDAINA